jgi:hypothetical protein
MGTPAITHDLTTASDASSTTGWSGWGSNTAKWSADSEIYVEGAASLGCTPNVQAESGYGYQYGSNIDVTSNLILIWVYVGSKGAVDSFANYGVYIRITDSTSSWTTTYSDFRVGGNDIGWVGGGWALICLDASQTRDRGSGTPSLTAIRRIGVGFVLLTTSGKSTLMAIDAIRFGSYMEMTGTISTTGVNLSFTASTKTITRVSGSFTTDGYSTGDRIIVRGSTDNDGIFTVNTVGTLTMTVDETLVDESSASGRTIDQMVTLEDLYQWDIGTSTYFYGVVRKNALGQYELNFPLTIGDLSGTSRTAFLSENDVVYFADQNHTQLTMITAQDTGAVTRFMVGFSSGADEDRVGFGGSVFSQANPAHGQAAYFDLDQTITEIGLFGSLFLGIEGTISLPAATGHYMSTVTFNGCGQADPGQVEVRNCTFAGYAGAADAALLWNESIDISHCNFLANTRAIEHPSAAGSPYGYVNMVFGANTYDVNNTSGSAINIGNTSSNAQTYTGSTVTFTTTVTLRVTVYDENGDPVQTAQTGIYALETVGAVTKGDELISGSGGSDTNASGVVQNTAFNYQGNLNVLVRSRKSSSGDSPRYKHLESPQQIQATGLDVIVTLLADPINN